MHQHTAALWGGGDDVLSDHFAARWDVVGAEHGISGRVLSLHSDGTLHSRRPATCRLPPCAVSKRGEACFLLNVSSGMFPVHCRGDRVSRDPAARRGRRPAGWKAYGRNAHSKPGCLARSTMAKRRLAEVIRARGAADGLTPGAPLAAGFGI